MTASIRRVARIAMLAVIETVYPRVCAGCGLRGDWLCAYCETTVPAASLPGSCLRCGVPKLGNRCGCIDLDVSITLARSAFLYDGWAASSVKQIKYHGEWSRVEHIAGHMVALMAAFGSVDGLIPVPLHPSKEKERGFNQSALLAEHLSRATGVPVLPVLQRTRRSVSQTSLSRDDRQQNVAGIFAQDPGWVRRPGGRYVLVDDVRTTGATLNACADALRPCSPSMIGALTFALDMYRDSMKLLREYGGDAANAMSSSPGRAIGSPSGPSGRPQARHRDG